MGLRLSGFIFVTALLTTAAFADSPTGQLQGPTRRLGPAPFELIPTMSMVMPTNFVLSNGQYEVPYSESVTGFPLFTLGAGVPLGTIGGFEFQGIARAGYVYKTSLMSVTSAARETLRDQVRLHWLPMSGAVRMMYEIPSIRFLKPTLLVGGGVEWFRQTGNLDGIDSSFWVPFVFFTPAITVFQGNREDWFGGFTFGTNFHFGLGPQVVRAWSFDLSLNIWL